MHSDSVIVADSASTKSEIVSKGRIRKSLYFAIKRAFDILIGMFGILCMLPLAFIIKAVSIYNRDYHSIFFKQQRIGKDGKAIYIYKFRTMIPNAEEELKRLLQIKEYKDEWDKNQKFENDPRITKIGRFLRKTSLDEIPQFINMFKGDMSFIGPRPLVPGELDAHYGNHLLYERVRPGITGWWAANGRSNLSYEERLSLEYYYVRNQSLKLDFTCIVRTIQSVIKKTGAK